MTIAPAKRPSPMANPLVIAVAISLLIHLTGFGVWKLGDKYGWWHSSTPKQGWLERLANKLLPPPKFAAKQKPPQQEPELTFIEVNPSMAISEAPKEAKFQGALSTQAASPKQADDNQPEVTGEQKDVLKITDDAPPKVLPLEVAPKIRPPEEQETEAKPVKAEPKGDLAFAKPTDIKPDEQKTEDKGKEKQTRQRPRTLSEARKRSGTLGPKMQQTGSSKVLDLSSSLDVKGTALGDYVAELVEAVKERWFKELEEVSATTPGRVVIQFRLHSNGRVSNAKVAESDVGELLSLICQKAIQDPSPYKPWPKELRREMNADYRDVSFTFHYLRQ